MDRIIFHIDVNSAYLSWEAAYALSHGESLDYRTIPSIVGGDQTSRRGIVLAKSIPAKRYGILTGESIYSALNKFPNLLIIPPHYERYVMASDAMVDLIKNYTSKIQRFSIDEVFADMSIHKNEYLEIAKELSKKINEELGFTVNIGIGNNKLLAKMASDFEKPNKIHTLFIEEIEKKMWPLDVGKLYMVGRRTKKKLNDRGIKTIGELANLDFYYMKDWLKKPGLQILNFANGIETSEVVTEKEVLKSVGNSSTTAFDVESYMESERFILAICEMVGMRLRKLKMCGQVISLYIRNFDFTSMRKQRKLYTPTDSTNKIFEVAMKLFKEMWKEEAIRGFGVAISELTPKTKIQLSMFEQFSEKDRSLNSSIDKIRDGFGTHSLERSTFLHSGISSVIGGVEEDVEYPMMKSGL